MQQPVSLWGHLLAANKSNRNGDKFSSVVRTFCYGLSQKTHSDSIIQNKHHFSPSPRQQTIWGSLSRLSKNTIQTINQNYIQKLHARYQCLIFSYLGDLHPQPHCLLPGTTYIHQHTRPHILQDIT